MGSDTNALGQGTTVLEKALDVVDAVAREPHGASQAMLSKSLGLPRTTLYRLLAKLVERGILRHDSKRRVFALGFKCFELARLAYAKPDLMLAASPELRMLRDLTGETAYLSILDEHEALCIERYDGVHDQRSHAALGQRRPLHCTSQGKAMLAALPLAKREALIKSLDLIAVTPASITQRRKLAAELKLTKMRGWSIDDEEIVAGVRCVGAAVTDTQGEMRGAISVAGPSFRMTRARIEALGQEVAEAARRIGAQLSPDLGTRLHRNVRVLEGAWAFRGEFPVWVAQAGLLFWADSLAPSVQIFDGLISHLVMRVETPILGMVCLNGEILVACEAGYRLLPASLPGLAKPATSDPAETLGQMTGQMTGKTIGIMIDQRTGQNSSNPSRKAWPGAAPSALCVRSPLNRTSLETLWVCRPEGGQRWRVSEYLLDANLQIRSKNEAFHAHWDFQEPLHTLAWDTLGETLYGLNHESGNIMVMQPGDASARRLTTIPKGSGRLAGLAVDTQGGIWTCLEDGWCVMRFLPDGRQEQVIGVPIPCPTGLSLGGPDMQTLYLTSARQSVSLEALASAPLSGRLFSIDTKTANLAGGQVGQGNSRG